ncbi:MAG: haloalkane dehalogenase [Thermoanaerobaculia bacterium]|nr:haloalkane dehalogenase [Thermoanaerobaculia bacterium]
MKFLRTPDERFESLSGYPFPPHYVNLGELRMHYVDEGPSGSDPVLMLHGEPSWSYLYRRMIPVCAEEHRVVVPDLIGFGKSDKPASIADYTYERHVNWMAAFVESLDLQGITLVCQDWGSLIGLRLVAESPERFARIVVGNGMLPTGSGKVPTVFKVWQAFARWSPLFPVSRIVALGCRRTLDAEERRAYDAPFPSSAYKAGARAFPRLVPTTPDDPAVPANRRAWEILRSWQKPFLTTFSNGDPIMRGGDRYFQDQVPGAAGQNHQTLRGGHFLQEDAAEEFANAVNRLIADTPVDV